MSEEAIIVPQTMDGLEVVQYEERAVQLTET